MRIIIFSAIAFLISFPSYSEITEEMRQRAKEAGVIIERDHDPRRTYLANDVLAKDTIQNIQKAYYMYRARLDKEAANLYLISSKRGYDLAQVEMGKIYLHGKGVEPNIVEAYKWFVLSDNTQGLRNAKILKERMTDEQIRKAELLIKNFIASYK